MKFLTLLGQNTIKQGRVLFFVFSIFRYLRTIVLSWLKHYLSFVISVTKSLQNNVKKIVVKFVYSMESSSFVLISILFFIHGKKNLLDMYLLYWYLYFCKTNFLEVELPLKNDGSRIHENNFDNLLGQTFCVGFDS